MEVSELAARLPWWASLLAALAAYAVLQPIATLRMPTPAGTLDIATTALAEIFLTLARIGQYLLPLAFLLAAGVSGFVRWRRAELSAALAGDATGTLLRGISRADFQVLVGEMFRRQGYRVTEPSDATARAGGDLELARGSRRYLVQCRNWKAWQVDAEDVRELARAMAAAGIADGFAVISGHFTPQAQSFARANGIALVDGRHLKEVVRSEQGAPLGLTAFSFEWVQLTLRYLKGLIGFPRRPAPGAATVPDRGIASNGGALPPPSRLADGGDAERAVGQELTALIRAEARAPGPLPAVAVPPRTPAPRPRRGFKPRIGRIADALGVLIALAGIWGGYRWFANLPDEPAAASWGLFGYGRAKPAPDLSAQRLQEVIQTARGQGSRGPIGQYRFGPDRLQASSAAGVPGGPQDEVADQYRTVEQLEAAFNAKYIPPAECNDWRSGAQMAECGNHRMRTRRAFIASGGKATAALFGGPADQADPLAQARREDWRGDGSQDPAADWRHQWSQEDRQDLAPEEEQVWQEEPSRYSQPGRDWEAPPEREQDWRRAWLQGAPQDPGQDWRQDGPRRPQ